MTASKKTRLLLPDRATTEELYNKLRPDFESVLQGIYQQIRQLAEKEGLPVTVKYRLKRFDNYCDKLVRLSKLQGSESFKSLTYSGFALSVLFWKI